MLIIVFKFMILKAHFIFLADRPVKVAFIQYNSINKLLESTNRGQDNKVEKLVISDVVSASIGRSDNQSFATRLTQPIRFNFETGMVSHFC